MRSLSFVLALLALAGVSWFWFGDREAATRPVVQSTDAAPQIILTEVTQWTTNAAGSWLGTLHATRVLHFDDDNLVQLYQPDWLSQQGEGTRHIRAQIATLRDDYYWTLEHQVRIFEQPLDTPSMQIRTEFLEYDTLLQKASTPAPVAIDQAGRIKTDAIGMDIDFTAEEFFLHDHVRTRYWP